MLEQVVNAAMVISQMSAAEARGAILGRFVGVLVGIAGGLYLIKRLRGGLGASSSRPEDESPAQSPLAEKRRFAQTLVSEIRLRNAAEVAEGRRHHDLAARFDQDLQRAYRKFVDRFGEGKASSRLFREEVVKILAGGDEGALGDLPWLA